MEISGREVWEAAVSDDARLPVDAILTSSKSCRTVVSQNVQRGISRATSARCSMRWFAQSLFCGSLGENSVQTLSCVLVRDAL